jgi:splicing factor 3A subunit 2
MKNHLGTYECKLCLTLHSNEGSYLAHTQGKNHQANLARRAAKEQRELDRQGARQDAKPTIVPKKVAVKIGRPGYKVTKIRDSTTNQVGLLFQIQYPDLSPKVKPRHRFMSAFEQKVESPDKMYQYLVFAAEPYESISFKLQSKDIDRNPDRFLEYWDPDDKLYTIQFLFKNERHHAPSSLPPRPPQAH